MASNATPKTIILRGETEFREGLAGGAVTPGHLVTLNSSGRYVVHPTAAGMAIAQFAVELEHIGKSIDDAYANNDSIITHMAESGDLIYALVAAAAGAIVIGDYLESAGDGTLRKSTHATTSATTAAAWPIARAVEAVDNSGGGSAVRIRAEIL